MKELSEEEVEKLLNKKEKLTDEEIDDLICSIEMD